MRFALFMITAMALWHRAGISSSSGGSGNCSSLVACVRICVVCVESFLIDVLVLWFGEQAFARVPESRDAFQLSCV